VSAQSVTLAEHPALPEPLVRRLDEERGVFGMWLFIVNEATLFASLFFAYYYLAGGPGEPPRWSIEKPPALTFALPMLGVLLVSSGVLHLGERLLHQERPAAARLALGGTLLLAAVFLVLTAFEYRDHFRHLLPTSNAYGSIFYAITSLHLAHLLLGVGMLAFVLVLPRYEPTRTPPHRAYHAAALYWHFVDAVWLLIVALLYVTPHFLT